MKMRAAEGSARQRGHSPPQGQEESKRLKGESFSLVLADGERFPDWFFAAVADLDLICGLASVADMTQNSHLKGLKGGLI